jgi:glutaredoxin
VRWLLLFAVICSSAGAADVYKWIDADGRVQFGDRPPAESSAEQLRIRSFRGTDSVEPTDAPRAGIVMLSTTWCGVCKQARQYFAQRGVAVTELDVERTEAGRAEYKRLAGRGVPIILVDKQRMNGFSAGNLESMLKASGY